MVFLKYIEMILLILSECGLGVTRTKVKYFKYLRLIMKKFAKYYENQISKTRDQLYKNLIHENYIDLS